MKVINKMKIWGMASLILLGTTMSILASWYLSLYGSQYGFAPFGRKY